VSNTEAFTKAFIEELKKKASDEDKMAPIRGLVNVFRRMVSKDPSMIKKSVSKMRAGARFIGKYGV
jgi:hypothetical protein